MNQAFHATLRPIHSRVIIDLQGEINAFANQELQAVYEQAENGASKTILLNFEQVSYINSTGIAMIVEILKKARQSQRRIVAYGLSEHYIEIFDISRLTDYIEIYPDESAALEANS
jgi:anti-sigma B factor antagonist